MTPSQPQYERRSLVQPRWRGDGKELFYIAPDFKLMSVPIQAGGAAFQSGTPQPLFESPTEGYPAGMFGWPFAVAPDGQRFLISKDTRQTGDSALTVVVNWLAAVKSR